MFLRSTLAELTEMDSLVEFRYEHYIDRQIIEIAVSVISDLN